MSPQPSSLQERAGLLASAVRELQLWWRLFWDGRVPLWVKAIPVLTIAYILSPIDVVSELFIPGFGYLDDLALLILAMHGFVALAPEAVVEEIRQRIRAQRSRKTEPASGPTIDAEYRVVDGREVPAGKAE